MWLIHSSSQNTLRFDLESVHGFLLMNQLRSMQLDSLHYRLAVRLLWQLDSRSLSILYYQSQLIQLYLASSYGNLLMPNKLVVIRSSWLQRLGYEHQNVIHYIVDHVMYHLLHHRLQHGFCIFFLLFLKHAESQLYALNV